MLELDKIEIFTGRAVSTRYNKELKKDTLIVSFKGSTVAIPSDEIDCEKEWDSIIGFLGREIQFIIIGEQNGTKIGSRKKVQIMKRESILNRLQSGEIMTAKVVNLLKYGAYLEVDGALTVLLKNTDFSSGFIAVKEVLKKGDTLKVKAKSNIQRSKILVECVNKYTPNIDGYLDKIEQDMIVTGTVKTLRPDKCFINLYPGVDGLASIPFHLELDEGMKVDFEVKKVDKLNKKIRGKVVSIKH